MIYADSARADPARPQDRRLDRQGLLVGFRTGQADPALLARAGVKEAAGLARPEPG